MIKKLIFIPLILLVQLAAKEPKVDFITSSYYVGFGWKTFEFGSVNNNEAVVNGDGIVLIVGKYYPKYDLKVEFSASALGYLEYKDIVGGLAVDYHNDIDEADYALSLAYGGGHRNDALYMFPHVLVGTGVKVIKDDLAGTINLPMLQAGVGFSVRGKSIEFFVKYYYDFLFNTQTFTATNGDVIDISSINGSLEVGLNYLF